MPSPSKLGVHRHDLHAAINKRIATGGGIRNPSMVMPMLIEGSPSLTVYAVSIHKSGCRSGHPPLRSALLSKFIQTTIVLAAQVVFRQETPERRRPSRCRGCPHDEVMPLRTVQSPSPCGMNGESSRSRTKRGRPGMPSVSLVSPVWRAPPPPRVHPVGAIPAATPFTVTLLSWTTVSPGRPTTRLIQSLAGGPQAGGTRPRRLRSGSPLAMNLYSIGQRRP